MEKYQSDIYLSTQHCPLSVPLYTNMKEIFSMYINQVGETHDTTTTLLSVLEKLFSHSPKNIRELFECFQSV